MKNISIRISEDDKIAVESIFNELGLTLSSATLAFYKQVIINNGLPFELKVDPFYSKKNIDRLKKSIAELEEGNYIEKDILND